MQSYYIACGIVGLALLLIGIHYGWQSALKVYGVSFLIGNILALPATAMMLSAKSTSEGKSSINILAIVFLMAPAGPAALPLSAVIDVALQRDTKNDKRDIASKQESERK